MGTVSPQLAKGIFGLVFLAMLFLASQIVLSTEFKLFFAGMVAVALTGFIFQMKDENLPIVILLVMMLGSCFRWDIINQTFYLRFFVLFVIVLKGLMISSPSRDTAHAEEMKWSLYHSAFLFVIVLGLISSFYSVDPFLTLQRAISFLLLFLVMGFYFWLRVRSVEQIEAIMISFWKVFCFVILLGCVFFLFIPSQMRSGGRLRLVLGNPNQLGHYCAMMSSVVVWYMYEKSVKKWFSVSMLALLLVCIVASGSRAAMIATFFSCGTLFFFCYRKKAIYVLATGIFLFSVHALLRLDVEKPSNDPSFVKEHVLRSYSLTTGSGRTGVWASAWQLIKQRPLLGYGFGITDRLFQMRYFRDLPMEFQGGHTHNSYIEELVNLGFIGSLPFFVLIAYFIALGLSRIYTLAKFRLEISPLYVSIFCAMLAGVVSGVFESWFTSVGSVFCFPFWFLGMLLVKMNRFQTQV